MDFFPLRVSSVVQRLSRSGSDSAESEPERPFSFRNHSTNQHFALFYLTQGRLGGVTRVKADSAESGSSRGRVKTKFHIINFI